MLEYSSAPRKHFLGPELPSAKDGEKPESSKYFEVEGR